LDHLNDSTSFSLLREKGRRLWQWTRLHKLKAFLILSGVFMLFEIVTIPWFSVPGLKTENPHETALMRQRIREADNDDRKLHITQKWIPLSRIPRHVINAIVVAEDGTFWEHGGFDWYEFQQSLVKNWEKKRAARGASTITQQLAKNLYLSTSKDPIRKLREWVITVLLEHHLDKSRILEIYLNVIEWGKGIFGIEAAARTYFGRSASLLSLEQAIRLAAVIPSPLKHRPTDNSRWVVFRRHVVQQRMQGRKYYEDDQEPEEDESDQAQLKENKSSQPQIEPQPSDTGNATPVRQDEAVGAGGRQDTMPTDSTDIDRGPL
jgi:monofunctional biosynthetic peptidoglycan transglycosylase